MEKAVDDEVRLRSKRGKRVGLPWGGGIYQSFGCMDSSGW